MDTDQAELLKQITSFLEKYKIPYMITGAWSVVYYGRPRASHDIDFVVELKNENIKMVLAAIAKLPGEFLVRPDSVREAISKKDMFNILHLPTMLKMDFWLLTEEPFDKSRFLRRQKVSILGQLMEIASPEDTIIQKLRWYHEGKIEKHLIDAAFVYQIQKKKLDNKYLSNWIEKLKLGEYFKNLDKINLGEYI